MSTPPPTRSAATRSRISDNSPNRAGVPISTGQGLARNPSLRSARPIRKTPARTSVGADAVVGEDAKAANAQILADLKDQVERAEQASESYRKQLDAMQKRLDDVANETTAAEEREFQFRTHIDRLQAELRESLRQNRELGLSYDSEKKLLLQDRENRSAKEADLHSVVNRLTETLKLRNQELASSSPKDISHRPQAEKNEQIMDDTNPTEASADQDYLRVVEEKDNTIGALRLELADFHLKIAEQEHLGDGRSQALEKELLDTKMRNARLQEENESFQMLLSEKTLKGDFLHEQSTISTRQVSSLAEELESAGEHTEVPPATIKMIELENKTLRESNKALTLYIDKIIGRLLQHEGFEHIITDKDDASPPPPKTASIQKALPDIPQPELAEVQQPDIVSIPNKNLVAGTTASTAASAAAGFLQRARSVVSRPGAPRIRPMSFVTSTPSANENPETAPSIPLARGHRRARSDQASDTGGAGATQQFARTSTLRNISGGPLSPGLGPSPLSPTSNQRMSYGPSTRPESSSNSVMSEQSQEVERESTDASSARASIYSTTGTILPGAVMKQSQLRPLRLVQEQADEDAQKKANRSSWMGWFNKGSNEMSNN